MAASLDPLRYRNFELGTFVCKWHCIGDRQRSLLCSLDFLCCLRRHVVMVLTVFDIQCFNIRLWSFVVGFVVCIVFVIALDASVTGVFNFYPHLLKCIVCGLCCCDLLCDVFVMVE